MEGGGNQIPQSSRQSRLRRLYDLKSKTSSLNETKNKPDDSKYWPLSKPTTSQPSTFLTDITNTPTPNRIIFV